jgi:hypothetical protein
MSKAMIDEAIQEAKDAKDRAKAEKAYNTASTTPAAPVVKKAKGGSVTRADGCVSKGHTRGKMV